MSEGRFAVLRLRDLRFVFSATLVSDLGDGIVGVALAFAVLDLTHSATDLGLVMAARAIAQITVTLIGGVVADRMSRRTVMIAADLVRLGGQGAIGALLISGHASLGEIIASQALVGAAGSFFWPASSGLLQAVAGEHAQEANALKVMASSGSGLLGPAIGGALVITIGASWALVLDGATYAASALLLSRVGHRALAATGQAATTFLADLRDGLREVTSRTWLWSEILIMCGANILSASYPVLAPLICKQHYGGASAYAALSVIWAGGMLVGGASLLRFKPRFPLRAGVVAFLPALMPGVVLGLHAPIYVVGLFQFASGIGMTMSNTLWWAAMQEHVPPEAMARVSSFEYAGSLAVQPVGLALAGPLAGAIGAGPALIACCGAAVLLNPFILLVRDVRMLSRVTV
jgi:MFS family permease